MVHRLFTLSSIAQVGEWLITAAQKGTYRFEVRRWPREVNAPISSVPELKREIDAWDAGGGKAFLIYAGKRPPFKTLPVAHVRLQVGEHVERELIGEETQVAFDIPLDEADYTVRAELLDNQKKPIAGAHYIYCRRVGGAN